MATGPLRPGEPVVLGERLGLIAVDSTPLKTPWILVFDGSVLWMEFEYVVNGTPPATIEVHAGIEGSAMGNDGTNSHRIVRFKDKTTVTAGGGASIVQVARMTSSTAGVLADMLAEDLTAASAAGSLVDGAIAGALRLHTFLKTLTGGDGTTKIDMRARIAVAP